MHLRKYTLLFSAIVFIHFSVHAQVYQPTRQSLDTRPVAQIYKDGKFGIFIHWDVYAVPGFSADAGVSSTCIIQRMLLVEEHQQRQKITKTDAGVAFPIYFYYL